MTFLAPWMLFGAMAAGVPIALHLLHRGHPKARRWAAMEFLRRSLKDTSSRIKFRNLLLLLARVAACLLAALALARPTAAWLPSWSATEAVIVLDTSASMGARERSTTRMDLARREARAFLESLPAGSRARVIATSDGIDNPGETGRSPMAVAADLEALSASDRTGDIAAGIVEAVDHLRGSSLPSKALLVISDMQPSGWERGSGRINGEFDRLPSGTSIRLRRVGESGGANMQVIDASPAAGFVLSGPRQLWLLRVRNGGTEIANGVVARIGFSTNDGSFEETEAVPLGNIGPGEERVAEAGLSMGEETWKRVLVRVTAASDRLDRDDSFHRVTRVRPRFNTLVIGSPSPRDKAVNLGVYWKQAVEAINPVPGAANTRTTLMTPESANRAELDQADMVVLAGLPSDGGGAAWEALVNRLEPWVRAGGVLLASPRHSGNGKPSTWLAPAIGAGPGGASVDLASLPGTPLAAFATPPLDSLGRISLLNTCSTEPLPGGRILARFSGGAGAMSVAPLGEGAVAISGLGSTPEDGDLVLHPLFVPLAQTLVSEALSRQEFLRRSPWTALSETEADGLSFSGPGGISIPAKTDSPGRISASVAPKVSGFWKLDWPQAATATALDFSFNTDPSEGTGWVPLSSARAEEIAGRKGVMDEGTRLSRAGGTEALGWILAALLVVLVGESFLAWWSGRPA